MKKLLIPLFLIVLFSAQAQIKNFTLSASTNRLLIKDGKKDFSVNVGLPSMPGFSAIHNVGTLKETFDAKTGFNIGTGFQVYQFKDFFIESGLSVQYYRYKRLTFIDDLNTDNQPIDFNLHTPTTGHIILYPGIIDYEGVPRLPGIIKNPVFPTSNKTGMTNTVYVQIPVTVGKKFLHDKLIVKLGLSPSFLVYGGEYKSQYEFSSGQFEYVEYNDTSKDNFNNVLINGSAQITYVVLKRIGIDVTYQRSFLQTYRTSTVDDTYQNVVSFGLSYHFGFKEKLQP